jgi:DNA invertase Pin-like site-specific DNA recombinase
VELGYARVSTAKQDLDRQVDALTAAGIAPQQIRTDKKSGATTDRPGLRAALAYARGGDVIVVHTLDRLGRTVRDTLNLIHELTERGIGVRNLVDPIRIDSTDPADPMAALAVVLLALFAQMERTYTIERAAHARAVAVAEGRRVGRPSVLDADKLAYAAHLREQGDTIAEIVTKTGIARTSLYRHLPPRPVEALTVAPGPDRPAHPDPGADRRAPGRPPVPACCGPGVPSRCSASCSPPPRRHTPGRSARADRSSVVRTRSSPAAPKAPKVRSAWTGSTSAGWCGSR